MSWYSRNTELEALREENKKLARDWQELAVKHEQALMKIKDLEEALEEFESEERHAEFFFDFNAVNVFSIERNNDDGKGLTIIGYTLPTEKIEEGVITNSDTVREWYLYCSMAQHTKLVEMFKASRK